MYRSCILFIAALVAGCAGTLPTAYVGSDAGHVIVGVGGVHEMRVSAYHLKFRRIADRALPPETQPSGAFSFLPGITSSRDYNTSSDSGVVIVSSMPPGQYELFSYEVYIGSALGATYFHPKEPFSIPFTVAPGQTVYVGNYQANRIDGTNLLGQRVMASPFFKISDRIDAEYAFATSSKPTLPAPVNSTPRAAVGSAMQLAR